MTVPQRDNITAALHTVSCFLSEGTSDGYGLLLDESDILLQSSPFRRGDALLVPTVRHDITLACLIPLAMPSVGYFLVLLELVFFVRLSPEHYLNQLIIHGIGASQVKHS